MKDVKDFMPIGVTELGKKRQKRKLKPSGESVCGTKFDGAFELAMLGLEGIMLQNIEIKRSIRILTWSMYLLTAAIIIGLIV